MSATPPLITDLEFANIDTVDEEAIKRRFGGFVRSLHDYLNSVPCLHDIPKTRRRWKARVVHSEAFGTLATEPRHWYTFHHGGRNEAQFNLGMFPAHFRVGLGFEFSMKKGGDPAIVHFAYACFVSLIRKSECLNFERLVNEQRLEVEWTDGKGLLQYVATERVIEWLTNPPREPLWIFVGSLLRRKRDAAVLADAAALATAIESVLGGFRPLWEKTQILAHAP